MAEIVNLRLARKARARAEAALLAERNRVRHGLGKAERSLGRDEARRAERALEGARREPGASD